jgi:p-cumate 2,3-dioxygenase alpha subunit
MAVMPELERLVIDDREHGTFRVHRSSMVSPELFALERERVFERCWLYVGHESELGNRGDFRRRTVCGRPLIFVRDSTGAVRVLLNACTHRGATICREDEGTATLFQCFYHAWTFDTAGNLVTVPDDDAYPADFDRAERALRAPPCVDSYRGFYFVSFNPDVDSLVTYLAGAAEYLDLIVDQSPTGAMTILSGTNKYSTKANWKLLVENSIDGYHAPSVHPTYFAYLESQGGFIATKVFAGTAADLGNGHAVIEGESPFGRPIARWHPMFGEDAREEIEAVRAELVQRCGEERAYRIADTTRNLLIFPNLIVNDITAVTVRAIEPLAPGLLQTNAWALAPHEESAAGITRRINSYLTFIGPGGFATPDDVEALESCQAGFRTVAELEYSDISRGMGRANPRMNEELQMRAFWRAWHAHMLGLPLPGVIEGAEYVSQSDSVAVGASAARSA